MPNWKRLNDGMLHCHRSILKPWPNSSTSHYSTIHRGGGGGIRKASTTSLMAGRRSPLLMVPPGVDLVHGNNNNSEKIKEENEYFHFFSVSEQTQIRVKKNLSVSWQRQMLTPDDAPCVGSGSCHSWLAFNHPHNFHSYLYNPLKVDSPNLPYIPLPSLETLPHALGARTFKFKFKSDHLYPSLTTRLIIKYRTPGGQTEEEMPSEIAANDLTENIAISSDPTSDNCTIMGIFAPLGALAFCKPGDDRWTELPCSFRPTSIVYFSKHQKFYTVGQSWEDDDDDDDDSTNALQAWDLRDPSNPKNQVYNAPQCCNEEKYDQSFDNSTIDYLVESSGDLLLVFRYVAMSVAKYQCEHGRRSEPKETANYLYVDRERENELIWDDYAYWTLGFEVHRFDFDHNKWEPVECLGDRALFVGSKQCFSVSSRDCPGIMENSIYFADDTDDYDTRWNKKYHGHDNGIFCLGEKIIKPCYPSRLNFIKPHPVWVAPNTI